MDDSFERQFERIIGTEQNVSGLVLIDRLVEPEKPELTQEELKVGYEYALDLARAICIEEPEEVSLPFNKTAELVLSPVVSCQTADGEFYMQLGILKGRRFIFDNAPDEEIEEVCIYRIEYEDAEHTSGTRRMIGALRDNYVRIPYSEEKAKLFRDEREKFDAFIETVNYIVDQRHPQLRFLE